MNNGELPSMNNNQFGGSSGNQVVTKQLFLTATTCYLLYPLG